MAGREKKDYRIKVANVKDWLTKLDFAGLTVAEIYSDVFGACDVMRPCIEKFMIEKEDADKIVQFLQVNLTDLDKDVKQRMAEEKKKEAERAMLAARQAASMAPAETKKTKEEGDDEKDGDEKAEGTKADFGDKFRIPIVEKYSKISPRPLFLFIKDGKVIDSLTTANPPLMVLMITNAMAGRKTTGAPTGLEAKMAEKQRQREQDEKTAEEKKEEAGKTSGEASEAPPTDVPMDVLAAQDSTTSSAIIEAFAGNASFAKLAKSTTEEVKARDAEDALKLSEGIQLALDKGVLPTDQKDQPTIQVDVLGKTADQVADEIAAKLGEAVKQGCIMTLEGLSGTGKGTTVAKLKEKLPNATTWSNGDIFRSITLLAAKFAEDNKHADLEEAIKPENLASFMKMLKFDKFEDSGKFDVEIDGLGYNERVSQVNKTLLKSKQVATNIPKVAGVTQGEVIMFVKDALNKMAAAGLNVLVEGRAATLKYIETPHRFELVMSDENIIGARRAAQRIGALALAEAKDLKDDDNAKTGSILASVLAGML
mmetsp:Transcript_24290/g.43077  ORF Transcript_24290/g.43077 Transcript_24290/m.43077 type:complete len:539 (-) Transcript_24290:342-1958(-)|eukprot:CAMPEP_0197529050 /NCGR_PEP_ID=MMETSP1318-20131121/27068_1 /TAXON_ID=552666 /ORGANISM="Partenskyella glossopodia, Strain RCC365" /LENGTH=538 /DNA_ID=CAMNT_0043084371 /DNA_START=83 /DNA_END=1699 /DNA_ORIENTATION=-